jgi:membrane dipeptidase
MSPRHPHAPALAPDEDVARSLGVTIEAVQITRSCEVIDLHCDTFIPFRLWGYDWFERHDRVFTRGYGFGHLDVPRAVEGGLTGAMWSITTNIARTATGRWRVFLKNLDRLRGIFASSRGFLQHVRTPGEWRAARADGAMACLIAIQGGNALDAAPEGIASVPDDSVIRVTLVHLSNSQIGVTSSPASAWKRDKGLTDQGRELVRRLNQRRVFVDLAHIHPKGFWDAVEVHDRSQPLIVTHTGVCGVKPHWRNIDDAQIKAVADTGGTIGVIFHPGFLRTRGGPRDGRMVVDHMQHIIDVAGEDFVSIGSDYDGAITPPAELRSGNSYPRLVQHMLDRGWTDTRIRKVLGGNFLRAFELLRPGA